MTRAKRLTTASKTKEMALELERSRPLMQWKPGTIENARSLEKALVPKKRTTPRSG
jgi:hypothetical protein